MTIENDRTSVQTMQKPLHLLKEVLCPYCWHKFVPEKVLWTSSTIEYDKVLRQETAKRFLPTRFDVEGNAIDAQNRVCKDIACPRCHMETPKSSLWARPLAISLAGGPASGKTYFLSSALRSLRRGLASHFFLELVDSSLRANAILRACESSYERDGTIVDLSTYRAVRDETPTFHFDDRDVHSVSPLAFALEPTQEHPKYDRPYKIERTIYIYAPSGSNYLPEDVADADSFSKTSFLGHSRALFFLFDPTQCEAARAELRKFSTDPQLEEYIARRRSTIPQEAVLEETVRRMRKYRNVGASEKLETTLVALVSKFDVCRPMFEDVDLTPPISQGVYHGSSRGLLRADKIARVREAIRAFLERFAPKFVQIAESSFNDVVYMPMSAMGTSPKVDPDSRELTFRSQGGAPQGVEEPFYLALSKDIRGALPVKE